MVSRKQFSLQNTSKLENVHLALIKFSSLDLGNSEASLVPDIISYFYILVIDLC